MKEFYGIKDKESESGSLAFLVDQSLNLLCKNVELSFGVCFNFSNKLLQLSVIVEKGSVVDYQSPEVYEAEYLFVVI